MKKPLSALFLDQGLNIPSPSFVLSEEAKQVFKPRNAEQGEGGRSMRKTSLLFLILLFTAPVLSGCFCPYWNDWGDRGYGHGRGYHEDRGYDSQRGGYRDSRGR